MENYTTINLAHDEPIISYPLNAVKAKIDKKSLAKLILNSSKEKELTSVLKANGFKSNHLANDHILHWIKRNWTHSLYYYLCSRANHLEDRGDGFAQIQQKVLESYKVNDGFPPEIKKVKNCDFILGKGAELPHKSVSEIIQKRKSVRSCAKKVAGVKEIAAVLYYGTDALRTNRANNKIENDILNAVNSFGTAFDIYLCAYNVADLASGLYFYDPESTALELFKAVEQETLREKMYKIQTEQVIVHNASYAILLVAHFERYQWRYRHEAALQHIFINAGQIMHPLILMATQFGHSTHISPAINDELMNELMEHHAIDHQTIYIMSAG